MQLGESNMIHFLVPYVVIFALCFTIGVSCWFSDKDDSDNPSFKILSARLTLLSFAWPLALVAVFFWVFYRIVKDAFTKME